MKNDFREIPTKITVYRNGVESRETIKVLKNTVEIMKFETGIRKAKEVAFKFIGSPQYGDNEVVYITPKKMKKRTKRIWLT